MASCSFACTVKELEKELIDTGNKLLTPPSSIDELLHLLDKAENILSKVMQDPPVLIQDALLPLMKALVRKNLLEHTDIYIKVSTMSCISEVSRITAPDAPYGEELMKEIFKLVAVAFKKLSDISDPCYSKAVNVLENAARVRFCLLLLDLECEALIIEMFQIFFNIIGLDHPHSACHYMEDIMTWIIEESDHISPELLRPILASLKRENQNASPISSKLGAKILTNCAAKVKPHLGEAVKLMSLNLDDHAEIVASLCKDSLDGKNVDLEESPTDALHLVENGGHAFVNAIIKTEDKKLNEAEGNQEQLLHQVRRIKQNSHSKHGSEKDGGKVSVLPMKGRSKRRQQKKEEESKQPKKRIVTKNYGEELVGLRIKVWWPLDHRFYEGAVSSFDPIKKKHLVLYTDGEKEDLNLSKQRWELLDEVAPKEEEKSDIQNPAVCSFKRPRKNAKVKLGSPGKSKNELMDELYH